MLTTITMLHFLTYWLTKYPKSNGDFVTGISFTVITTNTNKLHDFCDFS